MDIYMCLVICKHKYVANSLRANQRGTASGQGNHGQGDDGQGEAEGELPGCPMDFLFPAASSGEQLHDSSTTEEDHLKSLCQQLISYLHHRESWG